MNNNQIQFIIEDEPTVEWPVTVMLPVAGGNFLPFRFNVTMKVLSPEQYESLFGDLPKDAQMSAVLQANVEKFQQVIVGWDESVKDRSGNPVIYTPEVLAAQITGPRGPALSVGLWRAINEVRFGARVDGAIQPGAVEGN